MVEVQEMNVGDKDAKKPNLAESESAGNSELLKKQISDLQTSIKDKEGKYLYLYAEFENFKKRAARERTDLIKYGWESAARELLQVVDNLERALSHIPPETDKTFIEGLNMVVGQLKAALKKQGIEPIPTHQKIFDPNFHEAVSQEPSELPSGTIVKEHSAGYTLHGRLLRPAKVSISTGTNDKSS